MCENFMCMQICIPSDLILLFFFFFNAGVLCEALSCYPFITVMSKYLPCAFDGAEIYHVGPISSSGEMLCFSMVIWLS